MRHLVAGHQTDSLQSLDILFAANGMFIYIHNYSISIQKSTYLSTVYYDKVYLNGKKSKNY